MAMVARTRFDPSLLERITAMETGRTARK